MKKLLPCVVGLGYVGLPVFVSLKKKFNTIGFDIDKDRVNNLKKCIDTNTEFSKKDLLIKNKSIFTFDEKFLKNCNFYIITVPTPLKKNYLPQLNFIRSAIKTIAKYIKNDDIIFLESTVFPGTTEEFSKKILLTESPKNKRINFHLGYSSERINPGDKVNKIENITKVVSIKAKKSIVQRVKKVYWSITKKIVFTEKIKEAELSKLIENTQRDINISLMNEIMILCYKTGLSFNEVLRLAKTKWNFLNFSPGLVGGHCLPVDPYYLSFFAKKSKFKTKVTLAGREINNSMEHFIFNLIHNKLSKVKNLKTKQILIAGLTYKPNVADLRNSLALKILIKLRKIYKNIVAFDPIVDDKNAIKFNIKKKYDEFKKSKIIIFLVNHKDFVKIKESNQLKKKIVINPLSEVD
jgi:UDP-N-acetyl-D-galactosamine dehydrogenase